MKLFVFKTTEMKRQLTGLMACIFTCTLIMGCSPKVTTSILQAYPAIPIDSVEVFDLGTPLPPHEIIGNVSVTDRGTTTKWKYDNVLYLAKKQTADVGGNGLQIVTHKTPNLISTCHQIRANMLHITDHNIDTTTINKLEDTFGSQMYYNKPERHGFNVFKTNIGISRITSKVISKYGDIHKKGGMDFFLEYEHVGALGFGFGFNAKYNRTLFGGLDANLIYFGPSLVYSYITSAKLRWELAIGLGYASYSESGVPGSHITGVGFLDKIGIDYLISDNCGIGLEVNYISHRFSAPKGFEMNKNESYGYNTISLGVGFRYYF